MHSLKQWFNHSLIAQALVLFVLGMGFGALFRRDDHPGLWVAHSLIYTAVVIGFVAFQRRRTSRATGAGPRTVVSLNRKIRRREVPRDPEERVIMGRLIDDQLGKMERGKRRLPYWLGFTGLIAVGMLVLGATTGSLAFPLVFAVGVIAFCFWILWMHRRSVELHHHMRSALQNRG
ncbi:hypothetical protein EDD95_2805 [Streptomyces sp. CEV 2-1]|uniref:hypothetical protein n=1 Tax=Streptomyces sp. CEV 2-1 TaxID=2485153 RepID=UPI000F49F14C|nr:hypothetical protein [Streptomyces sp. CEV 2-1]ROQ83154.1 hypothetical protein EDD95_2805 [Streptomyces sp. CEV 2-1]